MTTDEGSTYAESGVDIDASEALLASLAPAIARTHSERVVRGVGHFGGFYRLTDDLILVASIDGVGTKLKVAALAGNHSGVGFDIVHHSINDIAACGARPICFLDYFATGHLDVDVAQEVIGGIARACEQNGVALIGGETAEMPGIYHGKDYDVAGVILGLVHADEIVDGTSIGSGDLLVGLPSSGFHTNGYSLIRRALRLDEREDGAARQLSAPLPWDEAQTVGDALLEPHLSYLAAARSVSEPGLVHGMAHITGGGIAGNLGRIIPDGLLAVVNRGAWDIPPLMTYVAERGHVSFDECFRVFNMGIGFILVCPRDSAQEVVDRIDGSRIIGELVPSTSGSRVEIVEEPLDVQL